MSGRSGWSAANRSSLVLATKSRRTRRHTKIFFGLICFLAAMRILPIAAQEAPTRAHFDRSAAFVLGSEQFKPLGDWKALYCQRNDPTACDLANIEVLASTCCKESLANGQVVVSFDYPIRPESRAYLFIKGLQTA